jgi:hypothetical protein
VNPVIPGRRAAANPESRICFALKRWIPGSACGRPGMTVQPLPTNGIWFAITVMNSTLVESGRPAM